MVPGGIGPRMLYSQNGMFVEYLATTFPNKFTRFLKGLQEGKPFEELFEDSFHNNVANALASYKIKLKTV